MDESSSVQLSSTVWCVFQIARVATFSADRPGYIAVAANSIGAMFDLTFKMRTFENDSLLVYAANENQVLHFAGSLWFCI